MDGVTSTMDHLRSLPRVEREFALERMVVGEFRAALLMDGDEELPMEQNFFDLGLTSLQLTDVKQNLETRLDRRIEASVLFNSPTVEQFLGHLITRVVPDLFR